MICQTIIQDIPTITIEQIELSFIQPNKGDHVALMGIGSGFKLLDNECYLVRWLCILYGRVYVLYVGAASCRDICVLNDRSSWLETAPTIIRMFNVKRTY
ncbi:MAG: hypothetical protein C0403_01305 [Desulfobacterium sp.]|nr:hypothetical protein [Desulfobacterium sp.]